MAKFEHGDWIQTYSGKAFNYRDMVKNKFDIKDIAHALSLICRFGGHTERFYSVAEHCFWCSVMVKEPFKLTALLHDASEAYMVDIPRPLKLMLPDYRKKEKELEALIMAQFNLPYPLPKEVLDTDVRMLYTEKQVLLKKEPFEWNDEYVVQPFDLEPVGYSPERAERMFLNQYYALESR